MPHRREQLAEYAHIAWSGWMEYLLQCAIINEDGSATIPPLYVERWQRQLLTPYHELPEHEKQSDRVEADKILRIIDGDI
jgi:hypothetical protein